MVAPLARHFGQWLKRQIALTGEPQTVFAERSGIPRTTLQMWFGMPHPPLHPHRVPHLARALGIAVEDLERELQEAAAEAGDAVEPTVRIEVLNVPGLVIPLPGRAPVIGGISAARLEEDADAHVEQIRFDAKTQFFLRCNGECMEPDYRDGEFVLFDTAPVEQEGIIDGEDYGIRLSGENAKTTFKRVYNDPRKRGVLLLRCVNRTREEFRKQMRVRLDEVTRIGKAIWAMRQPRARGTRASK